MHAYIGALAFAGAASARVLPRDQAGCCFQINASGGQSGSVGQLSDGQNRIGGGYQPATYCINNGGITDNNGRGCILTPPTTQFQCDVGATPTTGFSVSGSGQVQYNGNSKFYACGAASGQYNIYTQPVDNQKDCVEVTLSSANGKCAGNGGNGGSGGSSAPAGSAASSVPAGGASTGPAGYASSSAPASSQPAGGASTGPAGYGSSSQAPAPSQPAAQTSQPKPETSQPAVKTSQPAVGTSQPQPYTSQPKPETSQPAAETSQPKPATSQPAVGTSQPQPYASQPKPETSQPAAETSQPAVKTSQPAVGTSQPQPYASQPKPETSQPAVKTSQPAGQSSQPAVQTSQPQVATQSAPAPYPTGSSAQAPSAPAGTASSANSQAPSGTQPAGSGSGSACQTSLSGAYQTPHLILPISSEQPDQAYGTSYNGQINSTTSTIFNFDIPQDYEGKQCSIIFLFPEKKDLETSNYDFSGSGSLGCSELSDAASQKTSYSNAPSVKKDLGDIEIKPGNSYVVATQDCQAGSTQSIELSSQNGLSLNFFEDWNPSPLGLFLTSC